MEGSYELADDCHPIAGLWGKVKVHVQAKGEGQWWLMVQVANSMGCHVTRTGETLTVGPVLTTLAGYSLKLNSKQAKYHCV